MGRQKWFRSKSFLMLLHYAKVVTSALWSVAAQYIGNNHKPAKKGGDRKKKK